MRERQIQQNQIQEIDLNYINNFVVDLDAGEAIYDHGNLNHFMNEAGN
jgi:hypothetical protein